MASLGIPLCGGHRAFVSGPVPTLGSKGASATGGRVRLYDYNAAELRPWQERCRAAMQADAPPEPYTGLIHLTLVIVLQRPRGHYYTGRRCRELRPSAPQGFAYARRDLDKQQRAAGDCATGIWMTDDSHIPWWTALRLWPGCAWAEAYWGGPLAEPGAYLHCEELR